MVAKRLSLMFLAVAPLPLPVLIMGRLLLRFVTAGWQTKAQALEPQLHRTKGGRGSLVRVNKFWFGGRKQRIATAGSRFLSANKKEINPEIEKSYTILEEFASSRTSDIAVIVGNGPSLIVEDVERAVENGADPFISNYALLEPKLRDISKVYSVVNFLVAEQEKGLIEDFRPPLKVIPWWLGYCVNHLKGFTLVDTVPGLQFQSTFRGPGFSWAHTVSFFNIQLAVSLGYRKLILIGMDNRYDQPSDASEGDILVGSAQDPNHFRNDYFSGKMWQAASPELMASSFRVARQFVDKAGIEVVDCTVNGSLQEFRKSTLGLELGFG